jgi:hypothetical protein
MSGVCLRVLFGDKLVANFPAVLDEVKWCLEQPYQPPKTLWYVYGLENAAFLRSLGVTPILMDTEPFCRFGSDRHEQAHHYNTIRYGSSCWRHRYPPIRHALETHDEVVSLDLDTILMEPLPADFWQRMGQGACWQGTLQQNHRARSGWRKSQTWEGKLVDHEDSRKTPAGAFLYWRGFKAIDIMLRLYAERPFEYDLHVLAKMSDELMGGWKGWARYKELGYEPYCFSLGKHQGRQLFQPEQQTWVTHWRKSRLRSTGPSEDPYMLAREFPEVKHD